MPPTNYEPRLVEVPPEPGAPLVPYAPAPGADPGSPRPSTAGGPGFGFADLAPLILGAVLLVWALVASWPGWVLVVASVLVVIGLVLQVRKLAMWRRAVARPAAIPELTSRSDPDSPPLLLDLADPTTARLVGAYRSLVTTLAGREGPFADAAVVAAHGALAETATLVEGRPPVTLTDVEQLDARSAAVEHLVAAVRQTPGGLPQPLPADDRPRDPVAALDHLHHQLVQGT
jgi:hypothetical protein